MTILNMTTSTIYVFIAEEKCNITKLESLDGLQAKHRDKWGLDWFHEDLYAITLK